MKSSVAVEDLSKCTLFVRGIPTTCSNEQLSEVFSQAGPIKDCFVVKYKSAGNENDDKKLQRPCIGYVTYMSPDDAKTAVRKEKEFAIENNKLRITFAKKKKFAKKQTKTPGDTFEIVKKGSSLGKRPPLSEDDNESEAASKSASTDLAQVEDAHPDAFTVLVSGLPGLYNKEHALNMWKKFGLKEPIEIIIPCKDVGSTEENNKQDESKKEKGFLQNAKFIVETKQSALKACNKLAGRLIGKKRQYRLKATFLTPEGNFKAARRSRLIIRNVSFQCTEADLREAFDLYGAITEVKIPTKPNGQKRGFAFVQFSHVFEAARAIKAMNLQEIKGRKVAIDWSLPKEKYMEMNLESANHVQPEVKGNESGKDEDDHKSGDEDSASGSGDANSISEDSGMEDADSEEDGSGDETSAAEEKSDDDEEKIEQENVYKRTLDKVSESIKKHDSKSSHDVHEGRTVFIINLSYDTTEEQLSEVLGEYGNLTYTKIVINHDTGMSKGCGFAQFTTAEEAKNCIANMGEATSGAMLDGRQIRVVQAMSRTDADKLKKEDKKKKEKEDKRNLHLGREGLVRPGTQAAEGLSQIELKKREKIENAKRAKLRNPNIFISKTRLCLHNLPRSVDEDKLRNLLLKQFKDKKRVRITECRIMRDLKNLNEKGVGRPLGYAFVNFKEHESALKALRSLNNNPDIFGPIKRPIVEFALENKKALEIKEQRKRRFFAKRKLKENIQKTDTTKSEVGNSHEKVKKVGRRERQKRRKNLQDPGAAVKRPKLSLENESNPPEKKEHHAKKRGFEKVNSEKTEIPGERKHFQGSAGTTLTGKRLPLPVHAGPKIRRRNKGKIMEQMRKSKKLNSRAAQQKFTQRYSKRKDDTKTRIKDGAFKRTDETRLNSSRKRKKVDDDTQFNSLVAKYTKAIMDKTPKPKKTGAKWFE